MRMVEKVNVTPSTPPMAQRQMRLDNIEAANPKEYYKRVIAFPILGIFISEMNFVLTNSQQRRLKFYT